MGGVNVWCKGVQVADPIPGITCSSMLTNDIP